MSVIEGPKSKIADAPEVESLEAWQARLAEIGAKEGFYERLGLQHTALFVERGKTLVVSFDNLDHVYERNEDRLPWGLSFAIANGWSVLGLMAHDWTWYRDNDVFDFFDRLQSDGFFEKFDRVVFYGASMGAYAACVFSAAAPGSRVIAISPQATLDRSLTSWETRYKKVWRRDFTDRYGYAPTQLEAAERVYLFYDPCEPLDAMHVSLFQGGNITKFKCRYMGHRIASLWAQLGILKQVTQACIEDDLTPLKLYQWQRLRKTNARYQREMLTRLQEKNRPALLVRFCKYVLAQRRAPKFRHAMKEAQAQLKAGRRRR